MVFVTAGWLRISSSEARVICSCSATVRKTRKYCRFIVVPSPNNILLSLVIYMIRIIYQNNSRKGKKLLANTNPQIKLTYFHKIGNIWYKSYIATLALQAI